MQRYELYKPSYCIYAAVLGRDFYMNEALI